jgi:hypothetical protein
VIIVDTNVLSEILRGAPAATLTMWISERPMSSLFVTAITQAEMLFGVALLPRGKRRASLEEALAGLFEVDFAGRVLPFDGSAATAFADVASQRRLAGRPISQLDAQIAAIARSRGAALATRDVADFEGCGIEVVNPFVP